MTELREALADLAHQQWSGWMTYLFDKGTFNEDGTWTMPACAAERWTRQMTTPYSELPEVERASDRAEASRVLCVLANYFASWGSQAAPASSPSAPMG